MLWKKRTGWSECYPLHAILFTFIFKPQSEWILFILLIHQDHQQQTNRSALFSSNCLIQPVWRFGLIFLQKCILSDCWFLSKELCTHSSSIKLLFTGVETSGSNNTQHHLVMLCCSTLWNYKVKRDLGRGILQLVDRWWQVNKIILTWNL